MNIDVSSPLSNFVSSMHPEVMINLASFFEKETFGSIILVNKIWSEVFLRDEVQCLRLGLNFSDVDILKAIKHDEKLSQKLINQKSKLYKICLVSIKSHDILKAERVLAFLRPQQQALCKSQILRYYNSKKGESTFQYCKQERLEYFESNAFQKLIAESPCKKLKFDDVAEVTFKFNY